MPVLVRATVPDPLASVPAKVVEALPARPPDRVTAPATLLVIRLPATPAIEPTVSEKPPRSNVAPDATDSAELRPTPLAMPRRSVPALTVVAPVYALATESCSVPAPAFVRPPAPEIALVVLVTLPAPSMVRSNPPLASAPLRVSVPASDPISLGAASVIAPDQVLALARLRSAPPAAVPVPDRLTIGSAIVRPVPSMSISAPAATVVEPAAVPSAAFDWTRTTPALTVVPPVNVFVADSVSVPPPVLVSEPGGRADDAVDGRVAGAGHRERPGVAGDGAGRHRERAGVGADGRARGGAERDGAGPGVGVGEVAERAGAGRAGADEARDALGDGRDPSRRCRARHRTRRTSRSRSCPARRSTGRGPHPR